MIRTFFPIGQGAFTVERFGEEVNIVFDCGSLTSVAYVEQQIRHTFQPREVIQAVFISHLDEDHINGLEFLISYCRVKRLYLPYLTAEDMVLAQLCAFVRTQPLSDFTNHFLRDAHAAIREAAEVGNFTPPEIHYVMPPDVDVSDDSFANVYSGVELDDIFENWIFVPYNFLQKERTEIFKKALADQGVPSDVISSPNLWPLYKDKLSAAYKKVPGSLNTNSMVVYSGPKQQICGSCSNYCELQNIRYSYWDYFVPHSGSYYGPGCLYTGDYDASGPAKWASLKIKYDKYWDSIGVVQVPHHGSGHNWNSEFASGRFMLVISSGFKNSYRHPHVRVLHEILATHTPLYWVTEHMGSIACFIVQIPKL